MPHPAIIFAGLCVLVILLSAVLALFDVSVTYEVAETATRAPMRRTSIEGGTQVPERTCRPRSTTTKTS